MANRQKQDTRKPNLQPNHMPATIPVTVLLDGAPLGTVGLVQRDKLSEAGNITFTGGMTKGWVLPGVWMDMLPRLGFALEDGTEFTPHASGVHTSESGKPIVGHGALVELPAADGGAVAYQVTAYAKYVPNAGTYALDLSAVPKPTGFGSRGPRVTGEIAGLLIES